MEEKEAKKIIDCFEDGNTKGATKLFNKRLDKARPERVKQMTKGFTALLEKAKSIK